MSEREEPAGTPESPPTPPAKVRPRRRRVLGCLFRAPVYLTLLLLLVVAGLLAWLSSDRGEQVLARFVATRVADALNGAQVTVERVRWDLWPLSLEAENVVVPSTDPTLPPLAVLPLVRVDLRLDRGAGWGRPTLHIEQLYLREPRVYLQLDEDGKTNLPRLPESSGSRDARVRLAAVVVERGQVRFNATEYPLDFAARDVVGRLSQAKEAQDPDLTGSVTLGEVLVGLPKANPYPVAVAAKLRIQPHHFELIRGQVTSTDLRATAQGHVDFGEQDRRSSFTFSASGDSVVLERLGYLKAPEPGEPPLVAGTFHFDGRTDWQPGGGSVTGTLEAERLALAGRVFEHLTGPLAIDREQVRYDFLGASYAGGQVGATVTVQLRPPEHPVVVTAQLAGVDLRRLSADQGLDLPPSVTGRVAGNAEYRFVPEDPLLGQGAAEVTLAAVPGSALPLAGPASLTLDQGVLTASGARFASSSDDPVVTAEGRFDLVQRTGRFRWQARTGNVGTLARAVIPLEGDPHPAWLPTAGVGQLSGELLVGPGSVATDVVVDLVEVATPGALADRVTGAFSVSPEGVEGLDLNLERGTGRLAVAGSLPFDRNPLALSLDARAWPLDARIGAWLPIELGLVGAATGRLELAGTAERLTGGGQLQVASARLQGFDLGALDCDFGFAPERIELKTCVAATAAGTARLAGTSVGGELDVIFEAPRLDLEREPLVGLTGGTVAGVAAVTAHLQGTLERPRAEGSVTVNDLTVAGQRVGSGEPSQLQVDWNGESMQAELRLADAATFRGGGPLTLDHAALRFLFDVPRQALPLPGDIAAVTAAAAGEILIEGVPTDPSRLRIGFEADRVELRQGERQWVNKEPARVRLANGLVTVESFFLGEPESEDFVFVTGTAALTGRRELDLKLQATAAASWLQPWLGSTRLDGSIDALAALRGTLDQPEFSGQGELLQACLRFPDPEFPPRLDAVGAVVYFDPKQVKLDSLTARIGGGRLTASGGVDLVAQPQIEYLFEATLDDVDLRYPEGFVFRGDADVLLESTPEGRRLRGVARLERAYYLDDVKLGLVDLVRTALQGSRQVEGTTDPWLGSTSLALAVQAPGAVRVTNNLADLRGSAELQVRGTLARPLVLGTVNLDPGGFLVQDTNRFELQQGQLTWNGAVLDPVVDLTATARIKSYEVTLELSGQASRLRLDLTSDPPLPDLEVFSLLSGLAPDQAQTTAAGTESGAEAARRILVGQLGSALGQRVGTLFGLDQVSISPDSGQDSGSLGAVGVTVGKRLSKDLFVTYTERPGATRQHEVKVEWQVTDNLTLVMVGTQDEARDLTYSIDALWLTRF